MLTIVVQPFQSELYANAYINKFRLTKKVNC